MERMSEEKRRKFRHALLSLYHPLTPPPSPPVRPPQLAEEDSVTMVSGCIDLDLDPAEDADNVERETSPSNTGDSVPQKLTRAQRKRIRKRKLKEAASVRRKIVGPLLPSTYQNLEDEPHIKQWKEKSCDTVQRPTHESSGEVSLKNEELYALVEIQRLELKHHQLMDIKLKDQLTKLTKAIC